MKKICALLLTVVLFLLLLPACAEESSVFRGYNGKYQYIQLGEYPYDSDGIVMGNDPYHSDCNITYKPVLWRLLSVEDGTLLLITEQVIELQQVTFINDAELIDSQTYDYPILEKFADSDLCKWMNTDMFDHLFGQDPIVNAMLAEDENGERGKLFCLTDRQFCKGAYGFRSNKDPTPVRVASPTPYALKRRIFRDGKKKSINYKAGGSPYWCSTRTAEHRFQIVGYDGHLSAGAFTRENIGLRPSVRLDINLVGVESGSGTKKDPFILKYTGEFPEASAEPETGTEPEAEAASEPETATEAEPEAETDPEIIPEPETAEEDASETAEEGSPAEKGTVSGNGTALISFLGDCSIGDALQSVGKANSYHTVVDREGYAWPFSQVQKYLATDDLTVGNLEIVISSQTKHKDIVFPLRADPDHVNILLEGSIEAVNTANNHCWDFYRNGYTDTLQALDSAGVAHFGSVYYNRDNGFDDVLVKEINGIRIGFFGFTYPGDSDVKHMGELVKKLREEEHCDYIVASMHWGRETYVVPANGTIKFAKKILNLGVDMIYGHHPHVLQPIAFFENKPIFFSTGNCTFGTLSSNMDQHAGIFQLTLEKTENGTVPRKIQVIPCKYYKTGDYRIEEETDETEREKTFKVLSPGRSFNGCDNPPDSFLKTGVILFNETGEPVADQ